MKKKLILILTIFLLSGCSVEYNLEINDQIFNENIKIGKFDSSKIEDFEYLTPYSIVNGVNQEFYVLDYSNQILNLSYDYDEQNFGMSESFNQCYNMSNFSYDDKYYYILTSGEFKCLSYLGYTTDEIKINIKSNYKVVNSNADYIDDNVHTWVINKDNSNDKPINIVFDITETVVNNKSNKLSQFSVFFLVIVTLIVVGSIIFIIYLFGKKKNKV